MKTMATLLCLCSALFAQGMMHHMGPPPEIMDRIETLKMWKMTEALDLTEEQTAVLFPALRAVRQEQDSVRERLMMRLDELESAIISNADSTEILAIVDEIISLKKGECQIETRFMDKARSILSAEQQAKYILFERDFRAQMMELIRDFQKGKRGHGKMSNPWGEP